MALYKRHLQVVFWVFNIILDSTMRMHSTLYVSHACLLFSNISALAFDVMVEDAEEEERARGIVVATPSFRKNWPTDSGTLQVMESVQAEERRGLG